LYETVSTWSRLNKTETCTKLEARTS
jgi:hypothetical protein